MSRGPDSTPSRSRKKKRLWYSAAVVLLLVAACVIYLAEQWRREIQLAADIKRAGGDAFLSESLWDAIRRNPDFSSIPYRYPATVSLIGSSFDGTWLSEHDGLSDVQIADLVLSDTALSDAEVARLIDQHPLLSFRTFNQPIGPESVAAIGRRAEILRVTVPQSGLTDELLGQLPLERIKNLEVYSTPVTPDGLQQLSRCRNLTMIGLDGLQVTNETAELLGTIEGLDSVSLWGAEVTDEKLLLLQSVKTLKWVRLHDTQVTEEGKSALRAALPNCTVR
jgi:hypothetical protein